MIRALLVKGADVNARMSDGVTIVERHPDIVELLPHSRARAASRPAVK
jgi:hypothetical protein